MVFDRDIHSEILDGKIAQVEGLTGKSLQATCKEYLNNTYVDNVLASGDKAKLDEMMLQVADSMAMETMYGKDQDTIDEDIDIPLPEYRPEL